MKRISDKEYWIMIDRLANKQCITCEFCFPKIISNNEKQEYEHDYSETICASKIGLVPYGEKLEEKHLMSFPDCWSIGFDEYVRVAQIIEKETKCKV